ncbi:hypothetical protein CIB84_012798 [Bambusicola thoracicus]|uniref:Mitochondrial import receptor subunit TOM20 homolog n=1 Tax=Bambusicola thoracicus TaxID=9083 RepID=A0A2P4SH63_BAMTH|nr:hypothetical protein CIB84_012798 [Bambusicola thoracicus]
MVSVCVGLAPVLLLRRMEFCHHCLSIELPTALHWKLFPYTRTRPEKPLPDLKDAEAVQKFFLEEIQLGEELLAQGEYEKGVDHLTNAIAVCGQPQQLLQVLQQTLPPPVFQMLLTKLPTISQLDKKVFRLEHEI